jgi:uncharacterized protein (TIGR02118 family)
MSAKLVVLCGPPTDPDAFDAYFKGSHVPLVKAVPGLRSATASAGPIGTPNGPAPYHRVGSYRWDSIKELRSALQSQEGSAAAADLAKFATGGATLLIFEEQYVQHTARLAQQLLAQQLSC